MITLLWTLLAAITSIGVEYLYRTLPGPWWSHLYIWIPAQLTIGYAVYRMVNVPGVPLIGAFITWSCCTLALRVCVSIFLLHDKVTPGTWVAVGLLILAKVAQHIWK
jgi:hypothetical protein